jgi:hypothetical protein
MTSNTWKNLRATLQGFNVGHAQMGSFKAKNLEAWTPIFSSNFHSMAYTKLHFLDQNMNRDNLKFEFWSI